MTPGEPRLAVDLSSLQTGDVPSSQMRYAVEFLQAIERKLPPGHLITLSDGRKRPSGAHPLAVGGTRLRRDAGSIESLLGMPGLVYHEARFDLATPAIPIRLVSCGVPTTTTVLSPAGPARARDREHPWRSRAMGAVLRTFDLVLTPSDWLGSLLQDGCDLESRRCVNIGVGCQKVAPVPRPQLTQVVFGPTHPHVIMAHAGELEPPNWATLLKAVAQLPAGIRVGTKVVFLGRLSLDRERLLRSLARELAVADNQVVFAGEPEPHTAATWMQAASLLVHLSPGDGTGVVPLTAAGSGTPVLVADEGALPALFDWEPARVDPTHAAALADRIQLVFSDPEFAEELRTYGAQRAEAHTWEAVAHKAISAISGLQRPAGPTRRSIHPTKRRRLALVATFDSHSLVGVFNIRLAQALGTRALVDGFGRFSHSEAGMSVARRWPGAALGTVVDFADFDAVIYVVADDEGHAPILDAHLAAPGSLLLLNDSLARASTRITRGDGDLGILGDASQSAEHLLIVAPAAAEVVSAGLGLTDERRLTVLPVPSPEVDPGPSEPGRRHGVLILGSTERVIDAIPPLAAIAQVPALRATEVRVTAVGGGDGSVCRDIARAAGQLGLRRVHALPELSLAELRLALGNARVAVHVAGPGTEPLLLAEAQAAGTPVVSSGGTALDALPVTDLVDLLENDIPWISAHGEALRQAPSTKMEEIADIILNTLPGGR